MWGQDWASRVFPAVPSAKLAGCVDSRASALAEVRKLSLVDEDRCFTSLDTALDQVAAEALVVTTDLPSHIAVVKAGLHAGKHVLVEKPFAPSVAEAGEAVDLAESLGLTLMVSQNYRFFPAVRVVQQFMRDDQLGRLLHIDLDFRRHSAPGQSLRPAIATGTSPSCWTWRSIISTFCGPLSGKSRSRSTAGLTIRPGPASRTRRKEAPP